MGNLKITLTLSDDDAEALLDLLERGASQTTYSYTLAQAAARIRPYVRSRVDDARIARGRKIVREVAK
jgi:hypothetical protein